MLLKFNDYQSATREIDFNAMGQINESHQYFDSVCSVMDKLTFYVKRDVALNNSNLNESVKKSYGKDIKFNMDERIAAACIFNEMLSMYEENMKEELSICDAILNNESMLEEGVEYDEDSLSKVLSLNEDVKIFNKMKNITKRFIAGAKEMGVKAGEVIRVKKDELVDWAKELKKDLEEKYEAMKDLVVGIVKKGIDSVKKFIDYILEMFTKLGQNMMEAVKKLGGFKMDDDEKEVEIAGLDDTEELYKNMSDKGERSFFNNVVNRAMAILTNDKENAAKLMNESYVSESLVDNKFIAYLAGWKADGTKLHPGKVVLIGLCASAIVFLLSKILVFAGISGAVVVFVSSLVSTVWNVIGLLKLIYKRNKDRKPGEKFFDWKTGIFFVLSIVSIYFSAATFLKSIGPLLGEICNKFGWTGGDDMSKFGEFVYKITKKINPKDCFQEGGLVEVTEKIENYGGDFRAADAKGLAQSKDDLINAMENTMPGASQENIKETGNFLSAILKSKGGWRGVKDAAEQFRDSKDLPLTGLLDTSKWGGSGPISQAVKELQDAGQIPQTASLFTAGSEATAAASGGVHGFCLGMIGMSKDQMFAVAKRAGEIAGKDASTIHLEIYGQGAIADVITTTTKIDGLFNVITPNVKFLPIVIPFFDKKKWGKYKMRFASATRGSAAYIVDHVDMIDNEDAKKIEDAKALQTLIQLHDNAWAEYQKLHSKEVSEGLFRNKKNNEKDEKVEEPKYIAFYIKADEETGHDPDKLKDKGDSDSDKKEVSEGLFSKKKDKDDAEVAIGIVIDTLTMMCADVCNFNESVHIRKRPQPYFVKGLFSRLSFRPKESNDNETKDYIRQTLGQTIKTLATQCVMYGTASKYIDSAVEKKKAEFSMRETILGDDEKKFNPDKQLFELGNFSPNELLACVTDQSANNKIAYDFLDGSFASKVSIKKNDDGSIKSSSAIKDASTIENVKYYRVSKEDYTAAMDKWQESVDKWEKDGKPGKKPSKPTYIKGDDKEYYKRASKKWMADPENKRKKVFDFVDIRIIPLLKKGELYKKLTENEEYKKVLYKEGEEDGEVKLNKEVIKVLKPFLYRPEKTFAKDDEYQLAQLLKEQGVEGEKLGWFKNLFKDEKQIHDTFKEIVEIIWDYFQDNRRSVFKSKDFKANHGKTNEDVDYTLFDELLEEFFNEDYSEDCEYEYDKMILENRPRVLSFENFLIERY